MKADRWTRWGALAVPLLAACTLGPDYERPALDVPGTFHQGAGLPRMQGAADRSWWRDFGDPALDTLVADALASSQDVVAAAARVEAFQGAWATTRSALYPQVGAQLAAGRTRVTASGATPAPEGNPFDSVSASAFASWEIDLFGRIRRQGEAALADLRASEEFRRGVVLSLVASVTGGYIRLRDLDRELEVAQSTLKSRADAVTVFERRFRGGVVSEMELAQARSEYAAALRTVPALEQSIVQQENALSLLAGRNPGPIERGQPIDRLTAPAVPADLPSAVLERRPDVREAEQALVAANARIGAARALYFPTISLTAALGVASDSLSGLWDGPSRAWNFAGALTQPVFTAGGIAGQVQSAEAGQRVSLALYRKAVQTAFRETEDALAGVDKAARARDAQLQQVRALERYAVQARRRYDGGYSSYLEVLDAERSLFNAQLQLAQAQGDALVQYTALYKALGGGWVDAADLLAPSMGPKGNSGDGPAASRS